MFYKVLQFKTQTSLGLRTLTKLTIVTFSLFFNVICKGINSDLTPENIKSILESKQIYPNVVKELPSHILEISYPQKDIKFGERLDNSTNVEEQPVKVSWPTEKDQMYVVIMTDPDGPTRRKAGQREYQHWLVTNIPNGDIGKGQVLSEYVGPQSNFESNVHRYIFMAFRQPPGDPVEYFELTLDKNPAKRLRGYFSTLYFQKKYNLTLEALNFYEIDWTWVEEAKNISYPKRKYHKRGRYG